MAVSTFALTATRGAAGENVLPDLRDRDPWGRGRVDADCLLDADRCGPAQSGDSR